jgi:uncharacterized damage-inducible protein DinB
MHPARAHDVWVTSSDDSIGPFYAGWSVYNERIIEAIRDLSPAELALSPGAERWPVWAIAAHTASMRVYWLCGILGEPGAETAPFADAVSGMGWEDDLSTPRSAVEVVGALETTWQILAGCLERWTPAMLEDRFTRIGGGGREEVHTRQSVLMRMLSHDAYHAGEISVALGNHGLTQVDLWRVDA